MSEDVDSPKRPPFSIIPRQEVVQALRAVVEDTGATHPSQVEPSDLANKAEKLLNDWIGQQKGRVAMNGSREARIEYALSEDTIMFDAGYTNPEYVEGVLANLQDDLKHAKEANLDELVQKIETKIFAVKSGNKYS